MNKIYKNSSYEKSRKGAFTLAEVLITLGIIGVVVALTIVPLVKNYQEKALVNRLKETYSMLLRAHQMAVAEYGDQTGWDLGGNNSAASHIKFSNYYKPFLKISKDCGNNNTKGCFYNGGYKTFTGVTIERDQDPSDIGVVCSRIQLANGVSIRFWTSGKCSARSCGTIVVDLNGVKPPNKAGVDYFSFIVSPISGILQMNQV